MKSLYQGRYLKTKSGFTFIEVLMTLVIISITFLPLVNMFSSSLEQTVVTSQMSVGRYLAQEGMERIKNQNLTVSQLVNIGDLWEPPLDRPPQMIDKIGWRVLRKVDPTTNPLEIRVKVFKEDDILREGVNLAPPVVELVTLYEDFEWE